MLSKNIWNRVLIIIAAVCCVLLVLNSGAMAQKSSPDKLNSKIDALNKKTGGKWTAGITPYSGWTQEQTKSLLGVRLPSEGDVIPADKLKPKTKAYSTLSLPTSLDWRNHSGCPGNSCVTPVKDQTLNQTSSCGSCWAHATLAALESQVAMNSQLIVDLSEQSLISCGQSHEWYKPGYCSYLVPYAVSCNAGFTGDCTYGRLDMTSNYLMANGVGLESFKPYLGTTDSECSVDYMVNFYCDDGERWECYSNIGSLSSPPVFALADYAYIAYVYGGETVHPTAANLKQALNDHGPLVAYMRVYDSFKDYTSGIYHWVSSTEDPTNCNDAGDPCGHLVEVVGYNQTNKYFIAKNSWGTGWGESGFFRINYNQLYGAAQGGHTQFGKWTVYYAGSAQYQNVGSLTVNIGYNPGGGSGGLWRVLSLTNPTYQTAWHGSGETVVGVPVGTNYSVEFLYIGGYITPATQTGVTISTGQTTTLYGTYTQ